MSISGQLDPMPERRTQFAFKNKTEHVTKANIPNLAYANKNIDIEMPQGSKDYVVVEQAIKVTLILKFS